MGCKAAPHVGPVDGNITWSDKSLEMFCRVSLRLPSPLPRPACNRSRIQIPHRFPSLSSLSLVSQQIPQDVDDQAAHVDLIAILLGNMGRNDMLDAFVLVRSRRQGPCYRQIVSSPW
jgi:hypothetical protein